jgi:anti-sigma regulatory factor (Ser/Thr protein kinase)
MQNRIPTVAFEFDNKVEKLVSALEYMLGHIATYIHRQADKEDIMFRCKIIITELLTNAIKHAGKATTSFNIKADSKSLIIAKTDKGKPMYLLDTKRQAGENKLLVSSDALNSLYAIWENDDRIRFESGDGLEDEFLSVEQIMEHFGMLIITRSSDEFTYTYDKKSRLNTFCSKIAF